MNSTNTIFEESVTISKKEYEKLLEYREICRDILALNRGESQ